MDKFTDEQRKEADAFAFFYFDLLENHTDNFSFHLSDGAVLDWFGKTIKGTRKIHEFVKAQMCRVKHNFPMVEPCRTIGFRNTHVVEYNASSRGETIRDNLDMKPADVSQAQETTPPNNTIPSSSRKREKGQGDGLHNCTADSPAKRSRLAGDVIAAHISPATSEDVANISSSGHVEFHAKSSKKYQKETKWSRPCKFQVAYSNTPTGYLIHLIIYEGNMRCRRNLLKDFDSVSELE